jgi:hypothetical protein
MTHQTIMKDVAAFKMLEIVLLVVFIITAMIIFSNVICVF